MTNAAQDASATPQSLPTTEPTSAESDAIAQHELRRQLLEEAQSKVVPAVGLDVGTSFIGIALATTPIPLPLTTIPANDQAVSYIGTLLDDYSLKTIVVGVSENRSAQVAQKFAQDLKNAYSPRVKIIYYDETLSTQIARSRLAAAGKKIGPKDRIDQYAAAFILEEWLEEQ